MQPGRPSKQFIIRGSIALGIIVAILVGQSTWFRKLFTKKPVQNNPFTATIGDVVEKDSNGNGIPDWEEQLWGLDPTALYTNGVPNAELINQKKLALGLSKSPSGPLNETDRLAHELFTISTALGQAKEVNDTVLQNVASSLGSSVDITDLKNRYTLQDLRQVKTTTASLEQYYADMAAITAKYTTSTAEIDTIVSALETGDTSNLSELASTTDLYTQFAKDAVKIAVPVGVQEYHLDIVNGFAGIARAFSYISKFEENGVSGMAGVAMYKVYAIRLQQALINLDDYLTRYGILQA